ncbi:MAG: lipopolysaccharide biosynthesis protein [Muribaculaceae bacterium]|nr:lipopolysaccharide biosynthesis protein [Muribaculaceae bacterium]
MSLAQKLYFMFNSGKNPKWHYYLASYLRSVCPAEPFRRMLQRRLESAALRPDYEYMLERRDYCNRLRPGTPLCDGCPTIREMEMTRQKVYYLDTWRYARYFNPDLRLRLLPGDIDYVPDKPSVTKSRPIADSADNAFSVLFKLDRVRHFIFAKNDIPFRQKSDIALFRGKIGGKDNRIRFLEKFYGHPMVDAGDVTRYNDEHPEWLRHKLTIPEQLRHKFILALEGNDVASNLKWVMSSNSVAVMPRPTCESWFMEGTLIPDHHYIEIAPDFSDLPDRLSYYIAHPDECEAIIANANAYVDRFRDEEREDLISLMVLEKYFRNTGQL